MKKFIIILLINLLLFLIFLVISDIIIFKYHFKSYEEKRSTPVFQYKTAFKPMGYFIDNFSIEYRKPITENKYNKKPITIFGCSFAYGQYLDDNQIFSHKLHKLLNRPVYTRAYPGWGLQHMYYQISEDKAFNDEVPPSEYVIYVLMHDHYYRMLFKGCYDYLDEHFYIHYENKNGKLVKDNFNNVFLNLLKSCYSFKVINSNYAYNYIKNEKNKEKLTDNALLYFTESKRLLEEKWGKDIKFIVLFYNYDKENGGNDDINYKKELRDKLEKNGIMCADTKELTDEFLGSKIYKQDNDHPTEAAWDLLTPLFIKKLNLN